VEKRHKLLNFKDKIIYQNDEWFAFSIDSLLLANFVKIKLSDKKILDLCTGNAPVPMFLSYKTSNVIYGMEIQKQVYELGIRSIKENKMDKQIILINDDIKNTSNYFVSDYFDIITCNPPYFKVDSNKMLNKNEIKSIARHEMLCGIDDILLIAKRYLKTGGALSIVYDANRLIELIIKMRENNIEPKRLQFVYPKKNNKANIILVEGVKNGKCGITILKPLIIHNDDGSYKSEIKKMFQE